MNRGIGADIALDRTAGPVAIGMLLVGRMRIGDVHLAWENEAHLEVAEAKGAVEIVYPSLSIRAEPAVAWVDANVDRNGTAEAAKAYLEFLYTPAAQEIIGRHHYRPNEAEAARRLGFPDIELFSITAIAESWQDASDRFFADGAVFDGFYEPSN